MSEQTTDWAEKSWADLGLSGTGVPAAYLYKAAAPLDAKLVINKYENLAGLVAKNVAYEGMIVYVEDRGSHYTYAKIDEDSYDWVVFSGDNLFSNDTPITTNIGSITEGMDISNKTIQEVLTMMLCKYKPIEVGGTVTATASCGAYYVHQLPVLSEVQLSSVKLNSVTDAVFSLYDTSDTGTPIKTLSGQDLKNAINKTNNTLTFNSLGADGRGITIQEYKTYEIKYSYTDDKENKQTSTVSVGSYEIKFQDPTMALYNASNNQYTYDSTNSCYKLSAYNGQIVTLSDIYASISNGSARTIKKLEVFKGSSTAASITANNPTAVASGAFKGKYQLSFTNAESLTNTSSTKSTNYKVKAYYDKYNGYGTTTATDQTIEQTLSVSFSHHDSTISLTGLSGITSPRSKLDPLVITSNTLKASLYRRSDKVATVKLLVNGSVPKDSSNKDITSCVASTNITYPTDSNYDSAYYSNTKQDFTFSYSVAATDNICSTTKFKVGAYDASGSNIRTSSEQTITFKAPYCYGFVSEGVTFSSVDADTLKDLSSENGTVEHLLSMFGTINATGIGKKKFICAIPNGSYTGFRVPGSSDNDISTFEKNNSGTYDKLIKFADGSEVVYQIFIEKTAGLNTKIQHEFYYG